MKKNRTIFIFNYKANLIFSDLRNSLFNVEFQTLPTVAGIVAENNGHFSKLYVIQVFV